MMGMQVYNTTPGQVLGVAPDGSIIGTAGGSSTAVNWGVSAVVGPYSQGNALATSDNCSYSLFTGTAAAPTVVCRDIIHTSSYPGWSNGNEYGWFISIPLQLEVTSHSAGISGGISITQNKPDIGDMNTIRAYTNYTAGSTAPSDEGNTAFGIQTNEIYPMPTGNVTSKTTDSKGFSTLVLSSLSPLANVGVGRPIIDTASGVLTGSQSVESVTNMPGTPWNKARVSVTGFTVAQSSCGTLTAAVDPGSVTAINAPIPVTLTLTGLTAAVSGTVLGTTSGYHIETALFTAGAYSSGTQSFTAKLSYEYPAGSLFCIGGAADGRYVEQLPYAGTGQRYLLRVIGAPSTTELYLWENGSNFQSVAVKVFQGATLVDVRDAAHNNAVDGGQIVVGPSGASFGSSIENSTYVNSNVFMSKMFLENIDPYGLNTTYFSQIGNPTLYSAEHFLAVNAYPTSNLKQHGGLLNPAVLLQGSGSSPFAAGMRLLQAPEGGQDRDTGQVIPPAAMEIGPIAAGSSLFYYQLVQDDTDHATIGVVPGVGGSTEWDVGNSTWAISGNAHLKMKALTPGTAPLCVPDGNVTNVGCGHAAQLTFGAGTSDAVSIAGITSSSICVFSPTSSAAASSVAYISATGSNSVTITHSVASGATVNVVCQ